MTARKRDKGGEDLMDYALVAGILSVAASVALPAIGTLLSTLLK